MGNKYNYGLTFIDSTDLYKHVENTVKEYSVSVDLKKFNSNIIDPIKLTFDSVVYNQQIENIIESEVMRQLDKTNSNSIGYFHQNIFSYFGNGWSVPQHGYDIINEKQGVFCELKNKHNTMNSSSSAKTYMRMQNTLIKQPDATCYLVEVIAKSSQDIPWVITLDGERQAAHEQIRRISIDKLYEKVTGIDDAFAQLCEVLQQVIFDVVNNIGAKSKSNTVLDELKDISPNLLKSLYLLAFEKYDGFKDFNILK